jgi:hypothetical protein
MYHPWLGSDGQPLASNVISNLYADAWRNLMSMLVPNILTTEFISWQEQKEQKEAKNGGGNRNNNNGGRGNGGNGGGYKPQPVASDVDDDIPF